MNIPKRDSRACFSLFHLPCTQDTVWYQHQLTNSLIRNTGLPETNLVTIYFNKNSSSYSQTFVKYLQLHIKEIKIKLQCPLACYIKEQQQEKIYKSNQETRNIFIKFRCSLRSVIKSKSISYYNLTMMKAAEALVKRHTSKKVSAGQSNCYNYSKTEWKNGFIP